MAGWLELTFPVETGKGSLLVIDDERVNVLADPLRLRILETLGEGENRGGDFVDVQYYRFASSPPPGTTRGLRCRIS